MRAPVLGGNFGAWGGLFSLCDCAVKGVRQKEDPWNAIGAGFLTGGALAMRGGFKSARNGAIGCAVLLAVIEGVGIGFQKMMAGSTKLEVTTPPPPRPPPPPTLSDARVWKLDLTDTFTGSHATTVAKRRESASIIGLPSPTFSFPCSHCTTISLVFGVENLPTSEEI